MAFEYTTKFRSGGTSRGVNADARWVLRNDTKMKSLSALYHNKYSLSCDGTDDYFDTGMDMSSVFNSAFSISFWIKVADGHGTSGSAHSGSSNPNIFGISDNNSSPYSRFFCVIELSGGAGAGKVTTYYKAGGGDQVKSTTDAAFFSSGANDWIHMVFTVEQASDGTKIYKNGSAVAVSEVTNSMGSGVTMSSWGSPSIEFALGGSRRTGHTDCEYNMECLLDEISVWSDVLSSGEVSTIYNSGVPYVLTGSTNLLRPIL